MLLITFENLEEQVKLARNQAQIETLKNNWAKSTINNTRRIAQLPQATRESMLSERLFYGIYDEQEQPTVTDKQLAFEYQLSINTVRSLIDFNRVEERGMEPIYGGFDDNGYYLKEVV